MVVRIGKEDTIKSSIVGKASLNSDIRAQACQRLVRHVDIEGKRQTKKRVSANDPCVGNMSCISEKQQGSQCGCGSE